MRNSHPSPTTESRAVVLLSGGLDSTTVLAIAREEGLECHCLTVDYGQRHRVELEAAARVRDKPIHFTFIGGSGAALTSFNETVARKKLDKVSHIAWVPYEEILQSAIPKADLCLGGPFGNTTQSKRVVTGKTSQCLAKGKVTIIGNIDEDVGFIDRDNCLLVRQGDPQALADVLTWAVQNRESLQGIGDFRTMRRYHPRTAAANIKVPILILDQEEEEYGGRENSGLAALNALAEKTVQKYHVFPGTHYDIYNKNYKESADMALAWFQEHL